MSTQQRAISVQIMGAAELKKALDGDLRKAISKITLGAAEQVKGFIAPYAPASEANMPNHRWYERGFGPRWRLKGGRIGGRKTSEILEDSWEVERKGFNAEVGSRASYAPVVHSAREQAGFHADRGWVTDEQAVDKLINTGALDMITKQAVDSVLGGKK